MAGKVPAVAGDLLRDEAIVGQVVVEGADDVVAIPPGIREVDVPFFPGRFAETGHIQPMPPPAFAVVWAGQSAIEHGVVGVEGGEQSVDLLGHPGHGLFGRHAAVRDRAAKHPLEGSHRGQLLGAEGVAKGRHPAVDGLVRVPVGAPTRVQETLGAQ